MAVITVTDLFCGCGGSSSGAEVVPGVRVRIACNHSPLAIEVHNTNMPHVDHDVADIAEIDPRRYPTTDILWASPSCTFWSQARGEKCDFADQPSEPTLFDLDGLDDLEDELRPLPDEAKERSRALMHDVPRFAEYHRYKAVIVENVPRLLKWWYLPKWIARMRRLGYRHRIITMSSAFAHQLGAPAPQLRDRVYVIFWLESISAPDFDRWTRPRAWCPTCDEQVTALYAPKNPKRPYGMYWQQYVYRCPKVTCRNGIVHPYTLPAGVVVDWSNPGTRIGEARLVKKTRARIEAGLRRYGVPLTLEVGGNTFERRPGVRSWPVTEPLKTLHTTRSRALASPPLFVPDGVAMIPLRNNNRPKSVAEPLDTFAAEGKHHGLAMVPPGIKGHDGSELAAWNPSLLFAYDTGAFRSLGRQPLPTQTTVEGDALLELGFSLEDCLFRMLTPTEIKLGMAFASGFRLLGTNKEQVRMCGNAVTPPVARDLIAAVVEAITGDEIPTPV